MTSKMPTMAVVLGFDGQRRPLLHLSDAWFDFSDDSLAAVLRVACEADGDIPDEFVAHVSGSLMRFLRLITMKDRHVYEAEVESKKFDASAYRDVPLLLLVGTRRAGSADVA